MTVTIKMLQSIVLRINKETNSAATPYLITIDPTTGQETRVAQIGNYHLSQQDGGVCLRRMENKEAASSDVLGCGHVQRRNLAERMHAFMRAIILHGQKSDIPNSISPCQLKSAQPSVKDGIQCFRTSKSVEEWFAFETCNKKVVHSCYRPTQKEAIYAVVTCEETYQSKYQSNKPKQQPTTK